MAERPAQAQSRLDTLPELVLESIAAFLAPEEVVQLARTCKRLYSALPRIMVFFGEDFHIHGPRGGHWAPELYFDGPVLPSLVKKLMLSVEWKDQGWGNRKGEIFVSLVRGRLEQIVAERRGPLGIAPHEWSSSAVELKEDKVVTEAKQGDFYRFTRNAGGGGGHQLIVKNFKAIVYLQQK